MTWLDDDKSLRKEMLRCGDNVSLMGVIETTDGGRAPLKGNCVPLPLQIDALKRSIEYRLVKEESVETIEVKNQQIAVQQNVQRADIGRKPRVTITEDLLADFVAEWAAIKKYNTTNAASKAVMDIIRAAMRSGVKPE